MCLIIVLPLCVPGVTATMSALVEGKNFNQGGHKLGIGIDFEA